MKSSKEIREEFINFFIEKKHTKVLAAPVIPYNDPTLLFTNAGMNQFKDIFLGSGKRDYTRAVNSQKCIRAGGKHNDLDEVGKDGYHHYFFEMLGNWSFGDYYKKEAISWAWELLTGVWNLDKSKLYATVYKNDEEAEEIWKTVTDIDHSRISRHDDIHNFWSMGETGPCGPCSEIHYDRGIDFCGKKGVIGHKCEVNSDCGRVIEIWNLVFIQFNRNEKGELTPLPNKHVDTGMGFERVCQIIQGQDSNYHIDIFRDIIAEIEKVTGIEYHSDERGTPHRVIADHIRTLLFAIADGGMPSNEGRGYVLRRILRRAVRYGTKLEMGEPFIYKIAEKVAEVMGDEFPEIRKYLKHAQSIIQAEEKMFLATLSKGVELFNDFIENKSAGDKIIDGETIFKLYDTFGFPVDLTTQMADETGYKMDLNGFELAMNRQKDQSRSNQKFRENKDMTWIVLSEANSTEFVGYDNLETNSKIVKYRIDNNKIFMVPDSSSFYAESGGQIADKGSVMINGEQLTVLDVQKDGDFFVITAKKPELINISSETVLNQSVYKSFRDELRIHHSATHLLQSAIRRIFGDHIAQSGSFVANNIMRFDYSHYEKMSDENIRLVEEIVNSFIRMNLPIVTETKTLDEAKKLNVTALFGEKYGEIVRIVKIGDISAELCGGTHAYRTGDIGYFRILSESSIAAGIRRIEAVCGHYAVVKAAEQRNIIEAVIRMQSVKELDILDRLIKNSLDKKELDKTVNELNEKLALTQINDLISKKININGINIISSIVNVSDARILKNLAENLRNQLQMSIILLGAEIDNKASLVCAVTDDLKGIVKAGKIVGEVARMLGGGGGGSDHLATAGAKDVSKLKEAIESVKGIL
ncbi:MAG: alanine--tRNA ligase [Candidatus Delongbacteria bacterium]|nr:alanine--tRNA ligase [Candidatus Delongbacteria bacterium]